MSQKTRKILFEDEKLERDRLLAGVYRRETSFRERELSAARSRRDWHDKVVDAEDAFELAIAAAVNSGLVSQTELSRELNISRPEVVKRIENVDKRVANNIWEGTD